MFTGLIQAVGAILHAEPTNEGRRLTINPADLPGPFTLGDSIAIDGCCLTIADITPEGHLAFDAIPETLRMTTLGRLAAGHRVNLETALTPSTAMGGHFVQGHVDGLADVATIQTQGEWRLRLAPPAALMPLIIPKGSVTVAGVSLTVAAVSPEHGWFEVALIPTTLDKTNLRDLQPAGKVNLETDMLVRSMLHVMTNYADALYAGTLGGKP